MWRVGLQRQHHGNFLAWVKVGGVCWAAVVGGAKPEVVGEANRSSIVGPHPVVELQVALPRRQIRRSLDEAPRDAGPPRLWDDEQAEDYAAEASCS